MIFGDATLRQTLESARIEEARAVAVLTHNDMVNIEVGIALKGMLGSRAEPDADQPEVPIVLRVYDRTLGAAVGQRFDFEYVRSTVDLAAPWFIGAAMGLDVFGTFSVGQRSFMVGGVHVIRRARRMAWRWRTCRLRPASSRSPAPASRFSFIPGATRHSAPETPPTSSVLIGTCSTPCGRDRVSQQTGVTDPAKTG